MALIFCGPSEVLIALHSSAIIVFVLLTTLYLIPIWTYSCVTVARLTKSCKNKKSKSILLLPTAPVLLSFLSGLGIILPCSGVFIETIQDGILIVGLMLYFELAERIFKAEVCTEKKISSKKLMILNFVLSTMLFLLLWSKQIILFMDLINIPYMIPGETFFILSPETIARLVAIILAIASLFLSLAKLKTLHQEKVDIHPALYLLTLYFLYQAIWIFFLFIEENKLLRDLSYHFNKSYVSHFIKNIQKVFLVTIIGVPFVRSCILMNDQYNEKLSRSIEDEKSSEDEENVEKGSEKAVDEDEESNEKSEDDEGERRKSVTTFFSFTGNEVYHEIEDENGTHYATDEEGINRSM